MLGRSPQVTRSVITVTLREMEYGYLVRSGYDLKKLDQRGRRRRKEGEMKRNVVGCRNMTGRGQEVVDVMEMKKINVLCVQETRWKGQKAQEMGNAYNLYYTGEDCKRNDLGIAPSPGLKEELLQVNRESDGLIWMKLTVGNVTVNVVSTYAPQVGTTDIVKDDF